MHASPWTHIAGAAIICCTPLLAVHAAGDDRPARGEHRRFRHGGNPFDANGDMQLDDAEIQQAFDAFLARQKRQAKEGPMIVIDADADGEFTDAEIAAARKVFAARIAARQAKIVARLDTDGDGVLSDAEKAAARRRRGGPGKRHGMRGLDANGDLLVDEQEIAAAIAAAQDGKGPAGGPFGKLDADGDGTVSDAELEAVKGRLTEMAQRHNKMVLERVDTNGDGILSDAEKAAARAHRGAPRGRGRGRGAGGPQGRGPVPVGPPPADR